MGYVTCNILIFLAILTDVMALAQSEIFLGDHYVQWHTRQRYRRDSDFQRKSLQDVHACNTTNVLTELLDGYDKRLRPLEGYQPIVVQVGMRVLNLGHVNEINMDYRIDLHLMQRWNDPRLSNNHPEDLLVPTSIENKIWRPDTYFVNSKETKNHKVMAKNSILLLEPNGSLIYSTRLTVCASCVMDFHLYPVDTQECHLYIESFGYSEEDIFYQWSNHYRWSTSLSYQVRNLPQRNITSFRTVEVTNMYPLGKWSTLKATFTIRRHLGYFFLSIYTPCVMVVVLSWVSFFIPKHRVGARIKLCIIATLTIMTILNMTSHVLPQVPYIKIVDWYLIISFLFVFVALAEFTFVLWLTEQEMNAKELTKKEENKSKTTDKKKDKDVQETSFSLFNIQLEPSETENKDEPLDDEDRESECLARTNVVYFMRSFRVTLIDDIARVVYAVAYVVFNILYWMYFFQSRNKSI